MNYKTITKTPGVYLYKNKDGEIIYVGKAGNLRRRVSSYFRASHKDSRINELVREIDDIEIRKTSTVIEALILEAELIKKYQPKFNVREKDNKSFLYVAFTREPWPKPVLVRKKELEALTRGGTAVPPRVKLALSEYSKNLSPTVYNLSPNRIFGPFVSASSIRAALHILRKIFPYSTCVQSSSRAHHIYVVGVAIPKVASEARQSQRLLLRQMADRNDGRVKPCFNFQIGLCPGVCVGAITEQEYMRNIRNLVLFFRGKKQQILRDLKKQMRACSKDENFEEAGKLRNQIFALEHIRDTALIGKDRIIDQNRHVSSRAPHMHVGGVAIPKVASEARQSQRLLLRQMADRNDGDTGINVFGRIEGYDISNISGTFAVGSMVVFQNGEPNKDEYRRFKIKTIRGINDIAMLQEVLERRFHHSEFRMSNIEYKTKKREKRNSIFHIRYSESWPLPDLIVIDGGLGQVNIAREVLRKHKLNIPIIGIAKGFMRKQDRLIISVLFEVEKLELQRISENYKDMLLQVRDEAHRFAVSYHRKLRGRRALTSIDKWGGKFDSHTS